jgi:L-fucose isomerase-like protein
MALSLLNDEGKVAICEGDLEAGALMLIFHKLTGQSWMGNLAQVSRDLNAITLAHCTAATSLAELGGKIFLRSHFESDESVALDVPLKRQHATIANLQFKPLQIVVARGEVTESQIGKFSLCRTQARIRLIGDVETLLKNTGNHHVLAYGDWSEALSQIGQKLGLSVVTA